jgi:lipoyl(octanoyl) transferase
MKEWHFIHEKKPAKGAWNMAVDDYLFQNLSPVPETYLRFYSWKTPTASLGYSQKLEKVLDENFCRENGIDIVRRLTGGKLVLHFREVTYSLCSSDVDLFTSTLKGSYRLLSQALISGFKKMGIPAALSQPPPQNYARGNLPCFSYPAEDEIEVDGKKICGSAQKRTGGKFLQHGSIPLVHEEHRLRAVSKLKQGVDKVRMISISHVLGQKMNFDRAVSFFAEGIQDYFGVKLKSYVFKPGQLMEIKALQKSRHENPAWIHLR